MLINIERVEALLREEFCHVTTCWVDITIRAKHFLGRTEVLSNDVLVNATVFFLHMKIFEGLPVNLLIFPNAIDIFFDVIVSFSDTDNVPLSRSHHFLEEIAGWELVCHFKDDKRGVHEVSVLFKYFDHSVFNVDEFDSLQGIQEICFILLAHRLKLEVKSVLPLSLQHHDFEVFP